MVKYLFPLFLAFSLAAAAEEAPMLVKGVFQGKVQDQTFEQPFELRLEPGQKGSVRVDIPDTDLEMGLQPRWHYNGDQPDGMFVNVFVKCRNDQLRFQRGSTIMLQPSEKKTVELNEKDADNVFTVEVQAQSAPKEE